LFQKNSRQRIKKLGKDFVFLLITVYSNVPKQLRDYSYHVEDSKIAISNEAFPWM
jgi:hypothetical protein